MVGDQAPKLQTGQWVQGEPVPAFDTNHVYIVEFWATWCGPCVQSIPHLNQVWQKFKDKGVVVIGQDIWDSDPAVAPFVKKMGTNMTYRVALDDKALGDRGFMEQNWWPRGTNHHGIPTAFIINKDGMIAWIGHPMALKDGILEEIVSGRHDLARATAQYKQEWEKNQKSAALQTELFSALNQKQWDEAEAALNKIAATQPGNNGLAGIRLKILLGQKKFDEAYQLADSVSAANRNNADWQNELAWTIAVSDGPNEQCLGLAEKIAGRGVELTQRKDAAVLDTLARVQFMLGKKEEAIATEQEAVNVASDPNAKAAAETTLARYREGKLP